MADWSQYDDDWTQTNQKPNYTLERMTELEDLTGFKFSTTDKIEAFAKETDQVITDSVTTVTDHVGNAVEKNWKVLQYAPIIWFGAITIVILSWSSFNPLKKLKGVFA